MPSDRRYCSRRLIARGHAVPSQGGVHVLVREAGRDPHRPGQEAPAFLASFVSPRYFYKFHSFTLECAALPGTWTA